ncbi:hypothetical protein GCM10009584_18080 [Ornithinimicrobium humiphilum]|uniref:Uncharacterized protein n=1 Tax=Ornithinimicrobium humiphilum TaxID=125288 RepID=A0A543KLI2_9MICO|nr:hypothetical protein [Ornithinimicrobium humiphilum]TQM95900.1 hypothetical protein FB476_0750 [Ornithinimicrobium humiphilum]
MSDLQCAARIVVVNPPALGDVPWLASQLYREHVQTVYVADDVPGDGPVETLAEDLGVPLRSDHELLHDESDGLQDLADRHRGETVVVVRGGDAQEPALLLVDSDGISVRSLGEEV